MSIPSATASYFYKPLINTLQQQDVSYQNRSDSVLVAGDISQQYKMLQKLGVGSYGVAFKVKDISKLLNHKFLGNNEISVIKEINVEDISSLCDQMNEVRLMISLKDHPNIVKCLNCFVSNASKLCILQEYCDKGDL